MKLFHFCGGMSEVHLLESTPRFLAKGALEVFLGFVVLLQGFFEAGKNGIAPVLVMAVLHVVDPTEYHGSGGAQDTVVEVNSSSNGRIGIGKIPLLEGVLGNKIGVLRLLK